MFKKFLPLIMLAILLRLIVAVFVFHPDIKTINFQVSNLGNGVLDIYKYLSINKNNLPLKEEFVYFPLTYFTLGSYNTISIAILGQSFTSWLWEAGSNQVVNNKNIFMYLFFLKLPLFLADFGIAILLYKYFNNKEKGQSAFLVWLFNPFTIILIYAYSNIDIYVALLTLAAFLNIKNGNKLYASMFIGLAAAFKLYPLLFVPFLFLYGKNIKEKIILTIAPLLIMFSSFLPFLSKEFVNSAFISGLSTRIFYPSFSIGFGESIILSLFLITSLFLYVCVQSMNKDFVYRPISYFTLLLIIIFATAHYHISWLIWLAPFLIIQLINRPKTGLLIFLFAALSILIPVFYADRAMTISLFRTFSTWFDLLPTPFVVIEKFFDPYVFQSLIHSALSGTALVLAYTILNNKEEIKNAKD